MFRTAKSSSSGRLINAILWNFFHASIQAVHIQPSTRVLIWMHVRHSLKLHVQVFLRMKTWMFEKCRRHCN